MAVLPRRDALKVLGGSILVGSAGRSDARAAEPLKRMVVVHKIAGIPWVNMMKEGVEKGGKAFNLDATLIGPANPDPAQQVKLIEDMIAQRVDALGVVPLDEKVCAGPLRRAQAAGIKTVTLEGPGQEGSDWNVDLVNTKAFGELQMEILAKAMGGKGKYIIFVGTLTTPLHNKWADAAVAYQKARYPDMAVATDRFPGGDEVDVSQSTTLNVLKTYPDVTGILAEGSNGPLGAGNAIRRLGMEKRVAIVGTCVPSQARALIKRHVIRECTLWNPLDSGYALVAVADLLLKGEPITDGMGIGTMGKASVDPTTHSIQFNKVLQITPDNVDALVAQGL